MAGMAGGELLNLQLPVIRKIDFAAQIDFPALSNTQKLRKFPLNDANRVLKFLQKNNVAVDVDQQRSFCRFPGAGQQVTEQGSAKVASLNIAQVADLQFRSDFSSACFFAKEKDLRSGFEFRPTSDGIPLNDTDVPVERLGHGENRHR